MSKFSDAEKAAFSWMRSFGKNPGRELNVKGGTLGAIASVATFALANSGVLHLDPHTQGMANTILGGAVAVTNWLIHTQKPDGSIDYHAAATAAIDAGLAHVSTPTLQQLATITDAARYELLTRQQAAQTAEAAKQRAIADAQKVLADAGLTGNPFPPGSPTPGTGAN